LSFNSNTTAGQLLGQGNGKKYLA